MLWLIRHYRYFDFVGYGFGLLLFVVCLVFFFDLRFLLVVCFGDYFVLCFTCELLFGLMVLLFYYLSGLMRLVLLCCYLFGLWVLGLFID